MDHPIGLATFPSILGVNFIRRKTIHVGFGHHSRTFELNTNQTNYQVSYEVIDLLKNLKGWCYKYPLLRISNVHVSKCSYVRECMTSVEIMSLPESIQRWLKALEDEANAAQHIGGNAYGTDVAANLIMLSGQCDSGPGSCLMIYFSVERYPTKVWRAMLSAVTVCMMGAIVWAAVSRDVSPPFTTAGTVLAGLAIMLALGMFFNQSGRSCSCIRPVIR